MLPCFVAVAGGFGKGLDCLVAATLAGSTAVAATAGQQPVTGCSTAACGRLQRVLRSLWGCLGFAFFSTSRFACLIACA